MISIQCVRPATITKLDLNFRAPKPQCVADHGHRTETHSRSRDHRAEQQPEDWIQDSRRDRNAGRVVDKCEEQVLFDIAHRRAAESAGTRDPAQVSLY
jgi:hypothetical protein